MSDEQIGKLMAELSAMRLEERQTHALLDERLSGIEQCQSEQRGGRKVVAGMFAVLSAGLVSFGAWSVLTLTEADSEVRHQSVELRHHRDQAGHPGNTADVAAIRTDIVRLTEQVQSQRREQKQVNDQIQESLHRIERRRR